MSDDVLWTGTTKGAPVFWVLAAVDLVVAVGVAGATGLVGALPLVLVAVVLVLFTSVRVGVGRRGVVVATAYLPIHVRLPLDRITGAEAIHVRPIEWGGWGYRGTLTLWRRAAWVVRGGEGLRLDLVEGKQFAVTVDDAAGAAAAVNRLLSSTPR